MTDKCIITVLTPNDLVTLHGAYNNRIIIIKFGAEWCGPCKNIKPAWNQWIQNLTPNIIIADIDIDIQENFELYMSLKSKKMVKSIPIILAYYCDIKRDSWYIPDDSVIGCDIKQVTAFFDRCTKKINTLIK